MKLNPIIFALILTAGSALGGGFSDDFTDPKLEIRRAARGEWTFADGQTTCVADPVLYKKYKDHGPILRYPVTFHDGTVEYEFQAKGCERIVFTLNNEEGHVVRFTIADKLSRIFGWPGPSHDTKAETIAQDGVPVMPDIEGKWVKVKLEITGDKATFSVGDNYRAELQHVSLGRPKGEVTLGFAFGELSVRQFSVTAPDA